VAVNTGLALPRSLWCPSCKGVLFQVNGENGFMACVQVMSKCCACKFLYGATTSLEDISKLENALETQMEFKTEAEFYRKNGMLPA